MNVIYEEGQNSEQINDLENVILFINCLRESFRNSRDKCSQASIYSSKGKP